MPDETNQEISTNRQGETPSMLLPERRLNILSRAGSDEITGMTSNRDRDNSLTTKYLDTDRALMDTQKNDDSFSHSPMGEIIYKPSPFFVLSLARNQSEHTPRESNESSLSFKVDISRYESRRKLLKSVGLKQGAIKKRDSEIDSIVRRSQSKMIMKEIVDDSSEGFENESIMIDDEEEDNLNWDIPPYSDDVSARFKSRKKLTDEERNEIEKFVNEIKQHEFVQKLLGQNDEDFFQDQYMRKLKKDIIFLQKYQEFSKKDRKILFRITGLTIGCIIFETLFLIFNIVIFFSSVLTTSMGILSSLWLYEILLVVTLFLMIVLFSLHEREDKENLKLVARIGKERSAMNRLNVFILPDKMRCEMNKKKLEGSINYSNTHLSAKAIEILRNKRKKKLVRKDGIRMEFKQSAFRLFSRK